MLKKTAVILVTVILFACSLFAAPVAAAGRYFNTGVVPAAEWGLKVSVFGEEYPDFLPITDNGTYYEFSIPGLALRDTVDFQFRVNVGNLTLYETEKLQGLLNLDIYSNAGGYQLGRTKIAFWNSSTQETAGPGWGAIGVTPEGSLPSQQLVNMQVGFDMSANITFDTMLVTFTYTKSRAVNDFFRIYKTSTYQLFTGDLDSELLSEMVTEQKVTNDKLDELINQREQERDEADSTGNDALDSVTDAIPGDTQGVIDAFGALVEPMSYTGTESKWKFPAIVLPAIPGVMDEMQLTDEKEINFTEWISAIPADVLEIVQIVGTVALILFCFKELYGLIQYILTMKGGGAGE